MLNPKKSTNKIADFVRDWDDKYYFDYFWRKKYNIPFGSPQHREMNFFDMKFDLYESKMIEEMKKEFDEKKQVNHDRLLKVREEKEFSQEEIDDLFDNIKI